MEVRCSFITTTVRELNPRSHHKGATDSIRFCAIANLDKTSLAIGKMLPACKRQHPAIAPVTCNRPFAVERGYCRVRPV